MAYCVYAWTMDDIHPPAHTYRKRGSMMTDILIPIAGVGLSSLVAIGLRIWLCIARASVQRYQLFPEGGASLFWDKVAAFRAVTYDQHLSALFWGRDPMALYPEILRPEHASQ